MASTEGGTAEEKKQTDASIPNDQPQTNASPTFTQSGLQDSAQSWNPASQYALYMQWYYQYYYQMMYLSQFYNWQMFVSSQSLGSLPGSQFSPSVTGAASQTTGRQGFAAMQPNQPPATTQPSRPRPGSCEARLGTLPRRVMAEMIDFVFLYFTRFITFSLFYDDMDQANKLNYTLAIDENLTLEIMEEFVMQALAYRFLVLAYEVFFLIGGFHGSLGGATPGKYLMRLTVVSADHVQTVAIDQAGEKVHVAPGGNLGFWRALVRATIKNFSVTFLFPVCLTAFFFHHNRTIYDIAAGSAVVTSTSRNPHHDHAHQQ